MAPTSPNPLTHIFHRDIIGNAENTLSSWGNCMAEAYCKWPVIVAIIIAALIVLSVLFCIIRCACCGLECCCWCCSCFNRCCPSPRNSKSNSSYKQAPQNPPPQTYGYNPGMFYGPPQFATFDASSGPKKVTEDTLPAMPSWQTSQTRTVEDLNSEDEDDSAFNKEVGGSPDAIPLSSVQNPHEHEQLYEDPAEPNNLYSSSVQTGDPYSQPVHQQSQASQYADDNAYQYQDHNPYSYNGQQGSYQNPSHPYTQYNQQPDTYSNPSVPASSTYTSTYTSTYPPTYRTRASAEYQYNRAMSPASAQASQPQQYQSLSPTSPTGYRGLDFNRGTRPNFSRPSPAAPVAPVEAPADHPAPPAEMPGSLMPGGGQRYYSQPPQDPQELFAGRSASTGVSRKPMSGNNW